MQQVRDTELRGLVLARFYDARHKISILGFDALKSQLSTIEPRVLANICKQLGQNGLIEWQRAETLTADVPIGGRITADGIDVIEGTATAAYQYHVA